MPADPIPGRSLVTRQAVADIVRTAVLGSYGVTGFAASLPERLLARLGLATPGPRCLARRRHRHRARPDRRLRRADRRGRPAGRLGGPLRPSPCAGRRGRAPGHPYRRAALRARPARRRRQDPLATRVWSARATSPTAGRTSPDGAPRVRRRRAAGRVPRGRREPRGARRRDQQPERLPGPRRRHGLEHAGDGARPRWRRPSGSAGQPADRIAAAISFGALMGARGNSGVITSQIFRGMAEGLGGKKRFNGLDLAHALSEGTKTAYSAVAKPVEGTILTVIRESAARRSRRRNATTTSRPSWRRPWTAAEKSVARTPSLLAILREAGVVDSGGQGLYRLFQGALLHLVGQVAGFGGARPDAQRGQAFHARRARRRGVRLRDDVPAAGRRARRRSTSTASATTWRRSANRSSWPATRGRSRSTSTTSARTWSSATG